MTIKTIIGDGSGTGKKMDLFKRNGHTGAVVFTDTIKKFTVNGLPFFNPTSGISMNIDASFSGTPVEIHDGEDNTYWTGSSVAGTKFTFNSTDRANSGTNSVITTCGDSPLSRKCKLFRPKRQQR